ncbi:hypothetical protein PPL_03809 [Heterostelium album PN500]|uniref:Uncharacterized protein n=1 Tax=Heterostelium pallidum (strain ATCC 26659 / Pp 5 / PN500) TaxID=670386 RepID=D3B6Q5_HETP5|nr:hypothetical protein PPL_03809 [Heterostelium album PN500]EFA83025.1 hypothetical protein PPL_03809 [Heterostelium album PN500]|eukprot:XP_020435142.1 hypothetical protein PPL_03809 [Heterostelium album PN500]
MESLEDDKISKMRLSLNDFYSGDNQKVLQATKHIRTISSTESLEHMQLIIDYGLIARLLEIVQIGIDEIKFESAWALTNIAAGSTEQTTAAVEQGCIPIFIELLKSPNINLAEQALWCLGNISAENIEMRDLVISENTIDRIVEKYLPFISIGLSDNDQEVLIDSMCTLMHLSDEANDWIFEHFIDLKVIPRIVKYLDSSYLNSIVLPAIKIIGNMVSSDDEKVTQHVLDSDVVPHLKSIINHKKTSIRKYVFFSISNISAGTKTQVDTLIQSDILKLVINHVESASAVKTNEVTDIYALKEILKIEEGTLRQEQYTEILRDAYILQQKSEKQDRDINLLS